MLKIRNFQALYQFEGSLFAGFRFHEERRLLGICFWREGFEAAFGPARRGEKGVRKGGALFFGI